MHPNSKNTLYSVMEYKIFILTWTALPCLEILCLPLALAAAVAQCAAQHKTAAAIFFIVIIALETHPTWSRVDTRLYRGRMGRHIQLCHHSAKTMSWSFNWQKKCANICLFKLLKCEDWVQFSVLCQYKLNIFHFATLSGTKQAIWRFHFWF